MNVAPPSPRPTTQVPVGSPERADVPTQQNVSEEGEIPQSEHQALPARASPNVSFPPTDQQPLIPEDQPQPPPVTTNKESIPLPQDTTTVVPSAPSQ